MAGADGSVAVFGSINLDLVLQVERLPQPGETVLAARMTRHAGGKGANQAIAAARAGAAVRMIGAVGMDEDGERLTALLKAEGVNCDRVRAVKHVPTGTAFVCVDDAGENQIVVVAGANGSAAGDDYGAGGVRLAQLEVPLSGVARFLKAGSTGAIGILNAAPFHAQARPLLALADIVVMNEVELAGYCGERSPAPDARAAAGMARALLSGAGLSGAGQRVVVTRGKAGSIAVGQDDVIETPAAPAQVVDTTGAGDCFCGYLASGIADRLPLRTALARAHQAAALAVGRAGAAAAMPFAVELQPAEANAR